MSETAIQLCTSQSNLKEFLDHGNEEMKNCILIEESIHLDNENQNNNHSNHSIEEANPTSYPINPFANDNDSQYCKNHPTKEALKFCLQAGCTFSRRLCEECEKYPPHSSHPNSVVEAKKFLIDVELSLKELRMNSLLMNAWEMLEDGKNFILRHFQSMNNMLAAKSPQLVKILALIEQTENSKNYANENV